MSGSRIFSFILLCSLLLCVRLRAQTLHVCKDQVEHSVCELVCITPDQTQTIAFYKLPDTGTEIAQCISFVGCFNNSPYNITQPNATATVLSFILTRSLIGSYRCNYGSLSSTESVHWGTYPSRSLVTGVTNGSEIESVDEFIVFLDCFYSEDDPTITLSYKDEQGNEDATSDLFSCTNSTTSSCPHDSDFTSYDCPCRLRHKSGIECTDIYDVNGYITISNVESLWDTNIVDDITFPCKSDATDDTHNTCLVVIQGVWGCVKGLFFAMVDKFAVCVQFTYYVVKQWYFTCRYVFKGKVVYGLQLVIIAAITQLISMIPLLLAFTIYADNLRSYAIVLIPILFTVGPFIAVGIYLLYKRCCGQKEWLYTKFNTECASVKLSNEYGKKLNTVTKDKIYFKVKASNDLFITLLDNQQNPIVDIILGGYRQQSTHGATQNDRVVYVKDVLVSTECRIFVLECGHRYITVNGLSCEIEKPLLRWEPTNDDHGFEICDIVISNFMQVGSCITNEKSTDCVRLEMTPLTENQSEISNLGEQFGNPGEQSGNSGEQSENPGEQSGKQGEQSGNPGEQSEKPGEQSGNPGEQSGNAGEQSGNPGECIFLLRQGDCLLDNEDDSCGLSCGIIFVILLPIPWILCLLLRKLTDTNWIGLKLTSVCQNSVKPKAKEDSLLNVPIVLTNVSPKGGKNTLPAIGTTTTNENKPKKKKKKSKKQDKESNQK